MSLAAAVDHDALWISLYLIVVGLVSVAAVAECQRERPKLCGPFAIGQSAVGGCDYIGGQPRE